MTTSGEITVSVHNFGFFRLDGGAMFGSVPKNLWAKRIAGDQENCIPLALRALKINIGNRAFLVDVGIGDKWTDKQRTIFGIRPTPRAELGFDPSAITDIILTHLHFDHAGGISRYRSDAPNEVELTYPAATIHVQRSNLENARKPNIKERASYLPENVTILDRATVALLDGPTEIVPGLRVHVFHGHTRGQQTVEVEVNKTVLVFPTDLVPTSHHLPAPFHMGYDICAETILAEKTRFLNDCVDRRAIVVFQHDPTIEAGTVIRDERGQFALGKTIAIGTTPRSLSSLVTTPLS
jgi:glyoxylase-like metal-dependent hydrolase (beta-lactamase superfamily II)